MIEERDRGRRAYSVGDGLLVGVEAVDAPVVPRQPDQFAARDVGDGDDEPVALLGRQLRIVEGQVGERADPEAGELVGHPAPQSLAPVDAGAAEHSPRRTEHRHPFDRPRIEERAVIDAQRQLLELSRRQATVLRGRSEHRPDQSARGGSGDALGHIARVDERRDGAHQGDALDPAAGEDQIGLFHRRQVRP